MPKVCVLPSNEIIEEAVREAGGTIADASEADAVVWMDPRNPHDLKLVLQTSPASWVQLPFAGIESFFAAGVIDPGRTWTCAKGIYGRATAEQALALMLAAARNLPAHARVKTWRYPTSERTLAGSTALIMGTGGIGRALVEMLVPLRVRILAVNRSGDPLPGAERTERVDRLEELIGGADWVVVAAAMTRGTRGSINASTLARMKEDAWVINVARGPIVDTDALVEALRTKRIAGAALDVTDPEPLPDGHPLWSMENVIITSHTANTAAMAIPELRGLVQRNVERFARGEALEGLVDPELGY